MAVSPLEDRYKTEMNAIFEDKAKLGYWMAVEVALAHAHAKLGDIPKDAPSEIEKASKKVELSRVLEIEASTHHDLMAMVKALTEKCQGKSGAHVHLGATSYDIEDTATALQFRDAIALIRKHSLELCKVLRSLAVAHKRTVCVGRTHGQHAVPTTYGMKFALYYTEMRRNLERLDSALARISVGKMSGATGTMATFWGKGRQIQALVMAELGLQAAKVSNQVVQRDRHAEVLFVISLIGATLEKIAKEIRNLQRSEIMEVAEPFASTQVGSSTMPQKRNPHKSERICSLARVLRANVQTALENIALEHERDLSNSANERYIFAESFITCDYMLKQTASILSGLEFFPENIKRNLESSDGRVMAERVMIALAKKGMGRQDAHEIIRAASIESFRKNRPLLEVLSANKTVAKHLTRAELSKLFDYATYIGEAPQIVEEAAKE
jgi:adenylosuccinate lyase